MSQQADAKAAGTWPVAVPKYRLFSWGSNSSGRLGLGDTSAKSSPNQVGALTDWGFGLPAQGGGTNEFGVVVKSNGSLWSWGNNNNGQLGLGNTTSYSSPKQIGNLTDWLQSTSGYASGAVKTNGTLWMWGNGDTGQLGFGNTTNYSSPKQLGALTNWAYVANNFRFTMAIKTDGTLWGWGRNNDGQLGLGNTTDYSSPKQIGALTNWLLVVLSGNYSSNRSGCRAIKTDGTLWAWGGNENGRLGLGDTTGRLSPVQVGALTNWLRISAGEGTNIAVKTDGTLWVWGNGNSGALGLNSTTSYSSPVQLGALTDWTRCSSNGTNQLAIRTTGQLYSWGANDTGQLGLGNVTYYSSPKQIGALTTWANVFTSGQRVFATVRA